MSVASRFKRLVRSAVMMSGLLVCLASLGFPSTVGAQRSKVVREDYVKAALLGNFLKYVQWPVDTSALKTDNILVGVLGEESFGRIVSKALSRKTIDGKPVRVRQFKFVEDLQPVHLLFVGSDKASQFGKVMSWANKHKVLTVGEGSDFLESGGIIAFVVRNNDSTVRFNLNIGAARNNRLKIYPRLSALADKVIR